MPDYHNYILDIKGEPYIHRGEVLLECLYTGEKVHPDRWDLMNKWWYKCIVLLFVIVFVPLYTLCFIPKIFLEQLKKEKDEERD